MRRRLSKFLSVLGVLFLLALVMLGYYLFRPLPVRPVPASFHFYDLAEGSYAPLEAPPEVFGLGLSYAGHIAETASDYDPDAVPPVFRKHVGAFARTGASVAMPDTDALCAMVDSIEPGLGERLRKEHQKLPALLDYEGELGFVLMEDIDPADLDNPDFVPRLGFFITNDLSARTLAIMGEGQQNRYDYWGLSKSFPGFLPVPGRAWVPDVPQANGIPGVVIETSVNGEIRQQRATENLIYTPEQMLRFIHVQYPGTPLRKGTMVLTGTPGGVAMSTPRWLVRGANLVGMSRFKKLSIKLDGDTSDYLVPGDRVVVRGGAFDPVTVVIVGSGAAADPVPR